MMKNIALAVLTAFLAAAGYVGYHWNAMESWMVTPLDANGSAQTVVIPQGSSVRGSAAGSGRQEIDRGQPLHPVRGTAWATPCPAFSPENSNSLPHNPPWRC